MIPITITRSILVIIVPGLLAVVPWVLLLAYQFDGFWTIYADYSLLINSIVIGIGLIIGAVIEGAVSHLEVRWDKALEQELEVRRNWFDYLALATNPEPVGLKYIARTATAFYFELTMLVAVPISLSGFTLLIVQRFDRPFLYLASIPLLLAVAAAVFFKWQAKCSHKVLCEARKELNTRLRNTSEA